MFVRLSSFSHIIMNIYSVLCRDTKFGVMISVRRGKYFLGIEPHHAGEAQDRKILCSLCTIKTFDVDLSHLAG